MVFGKSDSELDTCEFDVEGGNHFYLSVDQVLATLDNIQPEPIQMIRGVPLRANVLRNPLVMLWEL